MFHWLRILNLSPSIYEKCVKSTVSNGKKFAAALMIFGDTALVCHQKFLSCRCKNRDFYRKFVLQFKSWAYADTFSECENNV
jgi:hypothetical protein